MRRREVLTVWILLSAPIAGFVAYVMLASGGSNNPLLMLASAFASACLLFLSWTFLAHRRDNWRISARFMAFVLLVEGLAFTVTHGSVGVGALVFGVGTLLVGTILLLSSSHS